MSAPLVSAIIPTYNRADFVGQAIESALSQRVDGGVEVVVVDDGSTDDTPRVLEAFGTRILCLRQANQREGAARNAGVSRSRGRYLAFLDSDDYWLPGKLAADVSRLDAADQPALVYSRAANVDPAGRLLGTRYLPSPQGDVFWALARESFVPLSTTVVRRDAFDGVGGFRPDPALSGTADWELWMRLAARWPFGFVEQVATCIRVHPRNMLGDTTYMERAMRAGVRYALADPAVQHRVGGSAGSVLAQMLVTIALNAYGSGRGGLAARRLSEAARRSPRILADSRWWGAAARVAAGAQIRRVRPRRAHA